MNYIRRNYSSKSIKIFSYIDQGNKKLWDGEKKAIKEFLKDNKKKYKLFIISKENQPDVLLIKK